MGLILVFLAVVILITVCVYFGNLYTYNRRNPGAPSYAIAAASISSMILGIFLVVIICTSYNSYVGLRTSYDATVKQYRQAVTIYVDHAQINVPKASLTDFKYEGYQGNVADFVRSLRKEVVWYNKELISKRVMKKNWFFSWLVVAPDDDMKVINLVE
jgi:hypothetical protein